MATGAKKHIHKYMRLDNSGLWACALSDCTHFMPRHLSQMVEGKQSKCWACNETFIIGPKQFKMDKPICTDCILKAEGIGIDKADAILSFLKDNERKSSLHSTDETVEVTDMDQEDDDGRLY